MGWIIPARAFKVIYAGARHQGAWLRDNAVTVPSPSCQPVRPLPCAADTARAHTQLSPQGLSGFGPEVIQDKPLTKA